MADNREIVLSEVNVDKSHNRKKGILTINLTACKYQSVKRIARRFGFKVANDSKDASLQWSDCSIAIDKAMDIKPYQRLNHFPGMNEICRKDSLARNMTRMFKIFPDDYNFFPRTWCLPADFGELESYARTKKNKTFIVKPDNGAQGKGIYLTRNVKDIKRSEHLVCQQYLAKPFLIDGFKFDFRLYVLVTSCDPLRVCVYKDGLARFATTAYHQPGVSNMSDVYMHLTNYAINKRSDNFVRDDEFGSKRKITSVMHYLEKSGYNVEKLWIRIEDVIIKTLISCHPILKHNYSSCFPHRAVNNSACFEILGFDVMLDHNLKPWLLEVNLSPSFHTDAPLDKDLKENLLFDTFNLIQWNVMSKRTYVEHQRRLIEDRSLSHKRSKLAMDGDESRKLMEKLTLYEESHMGQYRRVYPKDDYEELYSKYFQQSAPSLCTETIASRARHELIMQQRLDVETKRKEKYGSASHMQSKVKSKVNPESPFGHRKLYKSSVYKQNAKASSLPAAGNQHSLYDEQVQSSSEWDEIQRMSEMQKRDSLVRGLGIPELLHDMMSSNKLLPSEQKCQAAISSSSNVDSLTHPHQVCSGGFSLVKKMEATNKPVTSGCESRVRRNSLSIVFSPSSHGKNLFEDQSIVSEVCHLKGRGCEVSSLWKPPQRRLAFASNPTRPLLLCVPAPFIRK